MDVILIYQYILSLLFEPRFCFGARYNHGEILWRGLFEVQITNTKLISIRWYF